MYKKIKELCKQKGKSINQLEQDLGFTRGSIYKWNIHKPSVLKVKYVADYFEVSVESLIDSLPELRADHTTK